ncbi:MAG: GtrA family protein [Desulfurococcaceae archaeon]
MKLEVCVSDGGSRVCSTEPWLDLALRICRGVENSVKLASRVSLYRRLLMKILGLKPLETIGDKVVWAVVNNGESLLEVELKGDDWYLVYSRKLPRVIALALAEPTRVAVFMLVGASGVPVNLAVAVYVHSRLSAILGLLANPLASTAGFEASVLWNFTLHEKVTFRGRKLDRTLKGVLARLLKYHVASVISYLSQVLMATLLPAVLGFSFWLAQLLGVIVGFTVNFILGYAYTWSTQLLREV